MDARFAYDSIKLWLLVIGKMKSQNSTHPIIKAVFFSMLSDEDEGKLLETDLVTAYP